MEKYPLSIILTVPRTKMPRIPKSYWSRRKERLIAAGDGKLSEGSQVTMSVEAIEDEDWVIKGPHASLVERCRLDRLEQAVYEMLKARGAMTVSEIWRRLGCHLWEVDAALKRLRAKGLAEEEAGSLETVLELRR